MTRPNPFNPFKAPTSCITKLNDKGKYSLTQAKWYQKALTAKSLQAKFVSHNWIHHLNFKFILVCLCSDTKFPQHPLVQCHGSGDTGRPVWSHWWQIQNTETCVNEFVVHDLKEVLKKRSFYGQADREGGRGGVSPLGPDRNQM